LTYDVVFSPEADDHVGALTARERRALLDAVGRQLVHEPDVPTRHRRPLRANALATWRLRVGHLRVYYDVERGSGRVVVKAIGVKVRERVYVGGKEIKL
jgi:mRNA-degrading endonuclease RelE of RelBE toxin-antitoxin system